MPWEQRRQKRYFYRSERVRGRAVRRYAGTGAVGEVAATADALRRLNREIEARERQAEETRLREAEAPLLGLCAGAELLSRAALAAAGYRRHDRGQWRRRREPDTND